MEKYENETIAAIATALSDSGIGIVRISGENAIYIIDNIFRSAAGRRILTKVQSHTIHYGYIVDSDENVIDEVMVAVMKAPRSYTTEDTVEINCHGGVLHLNVKTDPAWRDFWRSTFSSVIPAYHQNKEHWNTIILDGTIPDEDIRRMIAESYDLVTYSPTKRIYEAVKRIPKGCVATYGQVAAMAGEPKMARAVGNALHKNPDPEHIPCYRVVNSKGELSGAFAFGGADEQANRLRADGIAVINNRVDLVKYGMKL